MEKEIDLESMKKLKKNVLKCINDLGKQNDLNPQETRAALDGAELYDWLCGMIGDCEMDEEYAERGYSRRMSHNGSMPMRGRGWYSGYPGYPREHMTVSYCPPLDPYYYEGDGGGYSESRNSMRGHGYSRHSIGDRVVAMMEKEMDNAESDYEKEELRKFIRMVRMAADEG